MSVYSFDSLPVTASLYQVLKYGGCRVVGGWCWSGQRGPYSEAAWVSLWRKNICSDFGQFSAMVVVLVGAGGGAGALCP